MLRRKLILLLAAAMLLSMPAHAHTREEVRAAWRAIGAPKGASPYLVQPGISAPYAEGALTDEARAAALDTLNFARWLAGLAPVEEDSLYDDRCQRAAVLLAALDYVDHNAPRPRDMSADFYASAHLGTTSGSIVKFNWMRPTILKEGVEYFLRDDGEANLAALGHRRWALNPYMSATGFGLANARSGNSYVVMYAHDLAAEDTAWDTVCWPSPEAFPAELMHAELAWSVVFNPAKYDLAASAPTVTLTEETGGLSYSFDPASGQGDGLCGINYEGYGAGPCLIFRPDLAGAGFTDYQQNQRWRVRIEGLVARSGEARTLDYTVEMIALRAVDAVNVEVSALEARLVPGERLGLSAAVIPAYADDLAIQWTSTDEAVATVDQDGLVTAVSPGRCDIVAASSNGRTDACALTVDSPE